MSKSSKIYTQIKEEIDKFISNADGWEKKKVKVCAKRARKSSIFLSKLFKEYRKATLEEGK